MTLKRHLAPLAAAALLSAPPATATQAQDALARQVAGDCAQELNTFCAGVTVGGGRKVACLFAHNDKLSLRCELSTYQALAELEHAAAALRNVAAQCRGDMERYCTQTVPGKGRMFLCLAAHGPSLTPACGASLAALKQPQ